MTQEEKELLLKDITARLFYQPMCEFTDTEDDFCKITVKLGYSLRDFITGKIIVKPYLRPMSSMTEEERKEYNDMVKNTIDFYDCPKSEEICFFIIPIEWLNKHHFDYRGLIEKGLAIEAPKGMYKTE